MTASAAWGGVPLGFNDSCVLKGRAPDVAGGLGKCEFQENSE